MKYSFALLFFAICCWLSAFAQTGVIIQDVRPLNLDEIVMRVGYPKAAQTQKIEGVVVARILVDTTGHYLKHNILSSPDPILTAAVEAHLTELVFSPARTKTHAVTSWVNLPFRFALTKSPREKGEKDSNTQKIGKYIGYAVGGTIGFFAGRAIAKRIK
jgi:TonB family protein